MPPDFHLAEWSAEFFGTALLLMGGLGAVTLDFGRHSPVAAMLPSASARLLLTGALFAATGSLIAVSPLGRLSGAHLNPAVTLAFWLSGKVHHHDLVAFVLSQCLGALAAATLLKLGWREFETVGYGVTRPGHGLSPLEAAGVEALMTTLLLLTILFFVSHVSTARWTPLAVWAVVTVLVWQGAPYTGTSLNPARSLGPAVVAGVFSNLWVYIAGPLAGSGLATGILLAATDLRPLTAKLFHDAAYPSIFMHDQMPA
jgi:aquaporin Z